MIKPVPVNARGRGREEEGAGGLSFDFKLLGADVRPTEVRREGV